MKESFSIVPAGMGPVWVLLISVGITVLVGGLLGSFVISSRKAHFDVSTTGLDVAGGMYGRHIAKEKLRVGEARTLNLQVDKEFQLSARTNGSGMPGYQAGWFRLRNGEKCLAFVTDQTRVVYVPTSEGYVVMMSVDDPSSMLTSLRRLAAS